MIILSWLKRIIELDLYAMRWHSRLTIAFWIGLFVIILEKIFKIKNQDI